MAYKQQLAASLYLQDLAAGAQVAEIRVEMLDVGPHQAAVARVAVNVHWPHSDPEAVEDYIAWLQAGQSAERFPSLAASNLFVTNHTFGPFWEPRHTVQLDILLHFPGVDFEKLAEVGALARTVAP